VFVTNHVLSGVVIGRLLERHPVAAFAAGVVSHLALDMVPHWGCRLDTAEKRELYLAYATRDGLLGLLAMGCATAAVDREARPATVAAMVGAALLDVDKPLLHFWGFNPFPAAIRRIHAKVQNESPQGMPNEIRFGISCAALDVVIALSGRRRVRAITRGMSS
jgi:hypothetical protein